MKLKVLPHLHLAPRQQHRRESEKPAPGRLKAEARPGDRRGGGRNSARGQTGWAEPECADGKQRP